MSEQTLLSRFQVAHLSSVLAQGPQARGEIPETGEETAARRQVGAASLGNRLDCGGLFEIEQQTRFSGGLQKDRWWVETS